MLINHIAQNDDIMIQIDSDVDGFTSAAALINYLNYLFPSYVINHIHYRLHTGKQHGIIPDTITNNIKLVIAPDSSSNSYEECKELANRGIDVLIIDHHEAEHECADACVINNQLCDYPTKSLSGVGMVYKFCSYIDELISVDYANQFLDLVALGMVADMMDLRDFETAHLIRCGIKQVRNPFFRGMVDKQAFQLKDGLSPFGIAFYIAPYVNATIRVGTQDEKLILFESMLDHLGYKTIPSTKRGCKGQMETRVEQACRNCSNIKNRQTKANDTSLEIIESLIQNNNLLENKLLIIQLEKNLAVDKNLTGLIANQLVSKYQKPTLVLNQVINDDKSISWEGSGRGLSNSKFDNFREYVSSSTLAKFAEGHANAFGCSFANQDVSVFSNLSNELLKDYDFSPVYKVDYIFDNNNMSSDNILSLASLKSIWGQGIEEPLIAIENIKVNNDNIKLMAEDKNPTLKITLPNGMSLIKFRSSREEYEKLCSDLGCVIINVVGKCERNIWNGIVSPQIIIEDYEITGKQTYYF